MLTGLPIRCGNTPMKADSASAAIFLTWVKPPASDRSGRIRLAAPVSMISLNWYRLYVALAGRDRDVDMVGHVAQGVDALGRQRVFEVEQAVRQHGVPEHDDLGLA